MNKTIFRTILTRRLFIIKDTSEAFNFENSLNARLFVIKNMLNALIIESISETQILTEDILLKKRKR